MAMLRDPNDGIGIDSYYDDQIDPAWRDIPNPGQIDTPETAPPPAPAPPTNYGATPAGFDSNKWNDPSHDTDKYYAGRMLSSGSDIDSVISGLNSRGNSKYTKVGTDSVKDSNGDIYDLIFDSDGPNRRPQWTLVGGPTWNAQNGGGYGGGGGAQGGLVAPSQFGGGYGYGNWGNDPYSQMINGGLQDIINSKGAPGGLNGALNEYMMARLQGKGPNSLNSRLESAREGVDRARKSQTANIQGILADRGLLSEKGITQGPEQSSYTRLEDSLAGQYGTTLRDIYADQQDKEDNFFGQAANAADAQTRNYLAALNSGTGRQDVVTSLALQSLSQDRDWNKFLANFGLDREKFANDVQNGNINNYLRLIQLYLEAGQNSNGGYF